MKRSVVDSFVFMGLLTGCPAFAGDIDASWVTVGDAGNPADSGSGAGDVAYDFRIGTFEVTNAEYAAFLNAKAALGNPLNLYSPSMTSDPRGGILRTGAGSIADPFVYTPKPNMANKPVNQVSWYDGIRFANWLHNGQGDGDTESGAYTLMGGTPVPANPNAIVRNPDALVWIPNNDEWHKAALYEPGASGNGYWNFATRSDAIPTIAQANAMGDISNPGANVVNYFGGADWNGLNGNVTTVGSAGPLSASFYGTFDMNGNVFEWTEDLIIHPQFGAMRARRGGSWVEDWNVFFGGGFGSATPTLETFSFGLRVASVVPEPATGMLLVLALAAVKLRRQPK